MRSLIPSILLFCSTLVYGQSELIPKPHYYQKSSDEKYSWKGYKIFGLSEDSVYTIEYVKKLLNSNESSQEQARIDIALDSNPDALEAYQIENYRNYIILKGGRAGIYYGLNTIKQLSEKNALQSGIIIDFPAYSYRGMHLDVSRHFFTIPEVKKYIDLLAKYKMNRFHWHLTDDQGWRIEIKKYPLLTQKGGYRKETLIGKQKDAKGTGEYDHTPLGGFYTQDQIREVVQYAADRHIRVIPEIEMPGHSLAAIASYPELGCRNQKVEVGTRWGVYDDVFCAGKDSVFLFLENVLDEVIALFPSEYIHIGGDEVVKTHWKTCPNCQKRMKQQGLKDEHELQSYFIRRIEKYLNQKGRKIIGWDEILEGGLAPNAAVMSWRGTEGGIAAAKAHHYVIMSPGKPCYFDHGQSRNPAEPLNIGGKNTLLDVYRFNPNPSGILIDSLTPYIIGGQANVWTEYITDWKGVEYMVLPRMMALSEALWTNASLKDSVDFVQRLGKELELYHPSNTNYRIPEPMGWVDSMTISQPYKLNLTPVTHKHTLKMHIDGKPITNGETILPDTKDRILEVIVSNGKRSSIPYRMKLGKK